MRTISIAALAGLGAIVVGSSLPVATPANAAVAVRIGIAAPTTECVTFRKNRHRYRVKYAYCAEPEWTGGPVVIEGVTYRENLHYRMVGGKRHFWIKGRWVKAD